VARNARCAGCGGKAIHDHHLVKQQRIRKRHRTLVWKLGHAPYGITRALDDLRLQVGACATCHPQMEDERLIPRELPDGFWDAVDAYSLQPDLPRWLGAIYDERRAEEPED
jgi:hypothetical protein